MKYVLFFLKLNCIIIIIIFFYPILFSIIFFDSILMAS